MLDTNFYNLCSIVDDARISASNGDASGTIIEKTHDLVQLIMRVGLKVDDERMRFKRK